MRLGLFMRQMALDWTVSRRQRVDFGAPHYRWNFFKFLIIRFMPFKIFQFAIYCMYLKSYLNPQYGVSPVSLTKTFFPNINLIATIYVLVERKIPNA